MKNLLKFLFLLSFLSCQIKKAKDKSIELKPNIILIVVDDLGYADFSPFENYDKSISTPNLSRLGKSGMVFTQAYVTAPVCSPSRAGIITGKNQFRWDKPASWGPGLPDDIKTLPEYLKEAGYTTARIGKNDLGRNFHKHDVREYPLQHGYDEFLGFSAHAHDFWLHSNSIKERTPDPFGTSALLGPLMYNGGEKSYEEGYLTDIFTDESIAYLKKQKDQHFFLTLSYKAVHHLIHEVPKKYLEKYGAKEIANYDPDSLISFKNHPPGSYAAYYDKYSRVGDIRADEMRKYYLANLNCLDDNIGRVLDALEETTLDKNTIIVFISDNGGSPLTGANNEPLTGGKYALWEGGIRVPMSITWKGQIAPNKIMNEDLDGMSLLKPDPERLLVWKWQKTWAVRKGNWKLIKAKENHWKSEPTAQYIAPIADNLDLKLFNLTDDPGERIDLIKKFPTKAKELEDAYKNWIANHVMK